jgi:hypothetical protein
MSISCGSVVGPDYAVCGRARLCGLWPGQICGSVRFGQISGHKAFWLGLGPGGKVFFDMYPSTFLCSCIQLSIAHLPESDLTSWAVAKKSKNMMQHMEC